MIVHGWAGCEIATPVASARRPRWRRIVTDVRRISVLLLAGLSGMGRVGGGRDQGEACAVWMRWLMPVSESSGHYAHARAVARRDDAGRSPVGRHGY